MAGYTGRQDDERAGIVALCADQLFFRLFCDTILKKDDFEWDETNMRNSISTHCQAISPTLASIVGAMLGGTRLDWARIPVIELTSARRRMFPFERVRNVKYANLGRIVT